MSALLAAISPHAVCSSRAELRAIPSDRPLLARSTHLRLLSNRRATVRRDPAGKFIEDFQWGDLVSNGAPVALACGQPECPAGALVETGRGAHVARLRDDPSAIDRCRCGSDEFLRRCLARDATTGVKAGGDRGIGPAWRPEIPGRMGLGSSSGRTRLISCSQSKRWIVRRIRSH